MQPFLVSRARSRASSLALLAFIAVFAPLAVPRACLADDPADIVPRVDIAYDLLASLAGAGRLPGYTLRDFARGDRLYTRAEIADILRRALPDSDAHDRFAVAERILREEFAPELHKADPDTYALDPRVGAKTVEAGGWVKARLLTGPDAFSGIGRFSAALPFGRDGYAVVSGGNPRDEWYDTGQLTHPGTYGDIENAFVHVNSRIVDVSVGQMPVRWGPGYSGALTMDDTMPSIPQIALDKTFLLPGTVGRHVGRIALNEFVGQYFETNDPTADSDAQGTRRFLTGRRLTFAGGPWTFDVTEAMKSTRLPDPEWTLVLPLWIYQNDWTEGRKHHYLPFLATDREPDTLWKNYQAEAGATYTADKRSGAQLYTELLIDDLRAPQGLGNGYPTPQKLGEQYGVYVPRLGGADSRYGARVEYTTIDPETYTNESVPTTWQNNGAWIGYPAGPNADVLFGRIDAAISPALRVALEGATRRPRGPPYPGYTDIRTNRVGAYVNYALRRNAFVGARLERGREDLLGDGRTRVETNATLGF